MCLLQGVTAQQRLAAAATRQNLTYNEYFNPIRSGVRAFCAACLGLAARHLFVTASQEVHNREAFAKSRLQLTIRVEGETAGVVPVGVVAGRASSSRRRPGGATRPRVRAPSRSGSNAA